MAEREGVYDAHKTVIFNWQKQICNCVRFGNKIRGGLWNVQLVYNG